MSKVDCIIKYRANKLFHFIEDETKRVELFNRGIKLSLIPPYDTLETFVETVQRIVDGREFNYLGLDVK